MVRVWAAKSRLKLVERKRAVAVGVIGLQVAEHASTKLLRAQSAVLVGIEIEQGVAVAATHHPTAHHAVHLLHHVVTSHSATHHAVLVLHHAHAAVPAIALIGDHRHRDDSDAKDGCGGKCETCRTFHCICS